MPVIEFADPCRLARSRPVAASDFEREVSEDDLAFVEHRVHGDRVRAGGQVRREGDVQR